MTERRPRTPPDDRPAPYLPPGGGLLLVDKPSGCTSHDVVGRLRRVLRTRRIGHAGTLDPMATGLLVLAVRPPVPGWAAFGFWALAAVGMGLGMSSTSVLVLRYSETGAEGRNSSALQVSDSLGGALGIGLSGAVFATWHQPNGSDAALFTWMWLAFGAVALTASLIAFRARPPVVPA